MNPTSDEEESLSPRKAEEIGSVPKRMGQDLLARKSWSLTDKKADQEVLMELGVSVLEPDGNDVDLSTSGSLIKSGTKRKRNIENVDPNVLSGMSPNAKGSPKRSFRSKESSPVAGPSSLWSPAKHSLQTEQSLEMTLLQPYLLMDEETPVAQLASCGALGPCSPRSATSARTLTPDSRDRISAPLTPLESEDPEPSTPGRHEMQGANSFAALSDEVMLGIFKWLPKRSLAHCMLVCKRWHRVASDETFWQRLELGNRTLSKGALRKIFARKPIIVRLASTVISEWHPRGPPEPSRIQYLDLSLCSVDRITLAALLERCPALRKLSVESVAVDDLICALMGKCSKMETLNLTMATGVTATGLRAILEGCCDLQSLNISWCDLCAASVELLGELAPQRLQRLNLAGAKNITDDMLSALVARCSRLVELDLSDCSQLGAGVGLSILRLNRLEHLALSRCYQLPPHVLTNLSSMPALQYLEVWGLLQDASLAALKSALPAIQINQFMHSAIARPTVGSRRTSIWGLRTRD